MSVITPKFRIFRVNLLEMRILDFVNQYPDEQTCREKYREIREKEGVSCKKCGSKTHYWKKDKECFECKKCNFRTSLRSGTVMENSNLPLRDWFIVMHLMTSTKKSFSAKELQRQLGYKRYEPIWYMMHKIRSVMGLRDDQYLLKGGIEIDEGYFESVNLQQEPRETKRGRGSEKQTKVLVMVESKESESDKDDEKKGRPTKKVGFLKMKVIKSLKSEVINEKIENSIAPGSDTLSDNYSSYSKISDTVNHTKMNVKKEKIHKILPWVHTTISNAKRLLLDVFHRIDGDFLNNYLNEFCYKFNRRYFKENLFERLLIASVNHKWNQLG